MAEVRAGQYFGHVAYPWSPTSRYLVGESAYSVAQPGRMFVAIKDLPDGSAVDPAIDPINWRTEVQYAATPVMWNQYQTFPVGTYAISPVDMVVYQKMTNSAGGLPAPPAPQIYPADPSADFVNWRCDRTFRMAPWHTSSRYRKGEVVMDFDGTAWVALENVPSGRDRPSVDTANWSSWPAMMAPDVATGLAILEWGSTYTYVQGEVVRDGTAGTYIATGAVASGWQRPSVYTAKWEPWPKVTSLFKIPRTITMSISSGNATQTSSLSPAVDMNKTMVVYQGGQILEQGLGGRLVIPYFSIYNNGGACSVTMPGTTSSAGGGWYVTFQLIEFN